MRPGYINLTGELEKNLNLFHQNNYRLPGIKLKSIRKCLINQIIASIRRIKYVSTICERDISPCREDPSSDFFDPLKAAIKRHRDGIIDDAFWLIFIAIHFGKNIRTGWNLAREVYGQLGGAKNWDWQQISSDPNGFRQWLISNQASLAEKGNFCENHDFG